ncbi:MAG: hypothetical protein VX100_07355 [Pseudomonadota bacterium]|nr:hypothetical protein [Pseudomonadota bacterium]
MKKLLLVAAMVAASLMLGGCSITADDIIKEKVDAYCKLSDTQRVVNRALFNSAVSPHSVEFVCAESPTTSPPITQTDTGRIESVFMPATLSVKNTKHAQLIKVKDLPPERRLAAYAAFFDLALVKVA